MVLSASAGLLPLAACGNNAPTRASTAASSPPPATAAPTTPNGAPRIQPGGPNRPPGASNVELPATFHLRPGGRLDPTQVSAPASVPVAVTVYNYDTQSHKLTVKIPPTPRTLSVPADGEHVSLRYGRLPNGSYEILIDGAVRAQLVVGVAPGP